MMKFKLVGGLHIEAGPPDKDGKATEVVYKPGDIIETKKDLAAQFGANKFQPVYAEPVATKK